LALDFFFLAVWDFDDFEDSAAPWTDSNPTLRRITKIATTYLRAILSPLLQDAEVLFSQCKE
jgi:hypothetical protein